MEKTCTVCKKAKFNTEFNKNRSKKDGLNNICRECSKMRSRRYYQENKNLHLQNVRRRNKIVRARNREFIAKYLEKHLCIDCGEKDLRVLDFDHIGEKKDCVAILSNQGCSIKTLEQEISQCEVRCANCHRKKTATQAGNWHKDSLLKSEFES